MEIPWTVLNGAYITVKLHMAWLIFLPGKILPTRATELLKNVRLSAENITRTLLIQWSDKYDGVPSGLSFRPDSSLLAISER